MKSLALISALACSGCFTTWAGMQAGGRSLAWDEQPREETVPLPAVEERLTITLPPSNGKVELTCTTSQRANETVYRAAYRYGSGWKKATALAFVTEAAAATLFLLTADREEPAGYAYGGFFALDALGTAALFFAPRKEQFSRSERTVNTPVRDDCPDGLMLEIAGTTFPVDAAGRIGEAGEVALDDWMKQRTGAVLVSLAGRTQELRIPMAATAYSTSTTLSVPVGTLTAVAE
ncbi:MAG TPA: hypothetical protein VIV11_05880 [Kofleriaceae bacterium]